MTALADRLRASLTWQESMTSGEAVRTAVPVGRGGAAALAGLTGPSDGCSELVFSGAGSSLYLSQVAASVYRSLLGQPAVAVPPSEILIRPSAALGHPRPEERPIVAISRSGSTSEIVRLVEAVRGRGGRTLGVTCRAESPLAELVDHVLVSPAGDERAIVMTRSFTSMLALLMRAIAGAAVEIGRPGAEQVASHLDTLADDWSLSRHEVDRALELSCKDWKRVVFLGGGAAFGLANEACLKLTEMSQAAANAWEPFEFRHGPISVCEPGVLIVGLLAGDGIEQERTVLTEAAGLGATIWTLDPDTIGDGIDSPGRLPLYLPPLQAFAMGQAFARGLDPDHPRHLTQVVQLS